MKALGYIFAFAALIFVAIFSFLVLYYVAEIASAIYSGAKELEPSIYVPLSVTILTASLGLAATLYTQHKSRVREIDSAHRERKIEVYLEFLKMLEDLLTSHNMELGGVALDEKEIAKKLLEIRTKSVLWASPGVIKALSKITYNTGDQANVLRIMRNIDKLQREMRKDIGLSNRSLENDFFVKIYLRGETDYQELLASN